jgi:hypothetical protein
MNQTLDKPTTRSSSPLRKMAAQDSLPLPLNQQARESQQSVLFLRALSLRSQSVYHLAILCVIILIAMYGLKTGDVIRQEACKAFLLLLLLSQIKQLSQPTKQS